MGLLFRYNGVAYPLLYGTTANAPRILNYKKNGSIYQVPAFPTCSSRYYAGANGYSDYYYDTSSPTVCFRHNGITYYCAKSYWTSTRYKYLSGYISGTSVSSYKSGNYYYKEIYVSYRLSVGSESNAYSPSYRLSYSVIESQGLSYSLSTYGDSFSGTARSGSYTSELDIRANGGNTGATVTIRFYLYNNTTGDLLHSTDVKVSTPWYQSSSSGGGGSGGE